jgi:hypothetical protein
MQKYRKSIPLMAFCLYFLKVSLLPTGPVEASILLILGSVAAYFEYKSNDQKIKDLESKLDLYIKDSAQKFVELEGVKSQVAGIKMATGYKTQSLR